MYVRIEQGLSALTNLEYRSGSRLLEAIEQAVKTVRGTFRGSAEAAVSELARVLYMQSPAARFEVSPTTNEFDRTAKTTREVDEAEAGMVTVFSEPAHRSRARVKDKPQNFAFFGSRETQ